MKKNHNFLERFSTALQICVILFAIVGIATAEDAPQQPGMPIILSGDIYVNGEKAPAGTIISVELDGKEVGTTELTAEGVYGDEAGNKLPITCEPEDCSDLEFYINGEKVKVDPVINTGGIDPDGFLSMRIDAEVSEENAKPPEETIKPKVSGGMGGGFGGMAEEPEPETGSINQEETAISEIGSEAPLEIEGSATSSTHEKSIPVEEGSNTMLIAACGLGLLLVVGLIVYKSKKKQ